MFGRNSPILDLYSLREQLILQYTVTYLFYRGEELVGILSNWNRCLGFLGLCSWFIWCRFLFVLIFIFILGCLVKGWFCGFWCLIVFFFFSFVLCVGSGCVLFFRCWFVLGGDFGGVFVVPLFGDSSGVEDSWSHLGEILVFSHDGESLRFGSVTVRHLDGILGASGLSLKRFRVLPLGGLTPRVGRVVVFSRFGWVYGPKSARSTFLYSISPRSLIHSSKLSCPSLTW